MQLGCLLLGAGYDRDCLRRALPKLGDSFGKQRQSPAGFGVQHPNFVAAAENRDCQQRIGDTAG
ncbi:hypothetical protein D3C87_2039100 [compost metagenome]